MNKLAEAVRETVDRYDREGAVQLRTPQRKRLIAMADDIDSVAAILEALTEAAGQLGGRLEKFAAQWEKTQADKNQASQPAVENAALVRAMEAQRRKSVDPEIHPRLRAEHRKLYVQMKRQNEAGKRFQENIAALEKARQRMESGIALFGEVNRAILAIALLKKVQSVDWLEQTHRGVVKELVRDWLADFKKEDRTTIPDWMEKIMLKLIQLPADLYSSLMVLLELRRKLARLKLDQESDLRALLDLSDKIGTTEKSIRRQYDQLEKLLAI